jgi:hypothetical protein
MADMTDAQKAIIQAFGDTFDIFGGASTNADRQSEEEIGVGEQTLVSSARNKTGASEADVKAVLEALVANGGFRRESEQIFFSGKQLLIG